MLSASHDGTMMIWQVFGDCASVAHLKGHQKAVSEAHWFAGEEQVLSASADGSLGLWDAESAIRVRRFNVPVPQSGPRFVNGCAPGWRAEQGFFFVSGGDDRAVHLWDARQAGSKPVASIAQRYQVTSVRCGAREMIFSAGNR